MRPGQMNKNGIILLVLLGMLTLLALAHSANAESDTLRVVSDDNYPPFIFRDNQGQLTGLLVDEWNSWSIRTGRPVSITGMDWNDALQAMSTGKYDVIETIFYNDERTKQYEFSEPYARIDVPIFFSSKISGIKDAKTLSGFVVAVKRGDAVVDVLAAEGVRDMEEYESYSAIIDAAAEGKVVVFAMDFPPAMYLLHKQKIQDQFRYTEPLYTGEFHRAVLKGNKKLLAEINEGFREIPESTHEYYHERWFGKKADTSNVLRRFSIIIAVVSVIVTFLLLWNRQLQHQVQLRTSQLQTEMEISKKRADDLLESEEKYRLMLDDSTDPIYSFTPDGTLRYVNHAFAALLGDPVESIIGRKKIQDYFDPEEQHESMEAARRTVETGEIQTLEVTILVHDEVQHYITSFKPLRGDDGEIFAILCIAKNITKRRIAEDALKEKSEELHKSEERLALAIEGSGVGLWDWLMESGEMTVNERWADIIGYRLDELSPLSIEHWRNLTHPEDLERIEQLLDRHTRGEINFVIDEVRMRHKDGRWVWILTRGKITERNENGEPLRMTGTHLDISERKQIEDEQHRLMERLQQAEKMEALGTLAGGVAHDLNNVLGILVGYAELLSLELSQNENLKNHATQILNGGQRAAAIIQDLLTLARRGVRTTETVNLNEIAQEFLETAEYDGLCKHHPDIAIEWKLSDNLPNIKGSSIHLSKSLMNLLSNAMEAIKDRGKVTIETGVRRITGSADGPETLNNEEQVYLAVQDTGGGISETDRKRIFEPFYTKKVMGRSGTGLGLAVVWGSVKDHNGFIDIQSEEGKGATFTLYFPKTLEQLEQKEKHQERSEYEGKGESILVVDDVPEQREMATTMLQSLGYKVEAVGDGKSAVEAVRTKKFDLLVLDMILTPEMDGLDTFREIQSIIPSQKAIVVSGYSETDRVKEMQERGAKAFVRKPYVLENIGIAVRKELDA